MPCARHELRTADRDRLRAETVERLRRGELCVLPTETVYGLGVLPSHAGAVARARALTGRELAQPFTWHLAERGHAARFVRAVPRGVERLLDRYWPGPLTVILPADRGGTVGMRVVAHEFTRDVIAACGEPLWLSSVNRAGEPPLLEPGAIVAQFGDVVDLVVDDGPSPLGMASTIVRKVGPALEVLREGILSSGEILRTAADLVLFVCTGNTCRSPLAEAIARAETAKALGVPAAAVLAHGVGFASAGLSTLDDMPASENSIIAGAEAQLDLHGHATRVLTPGLIERARAVYCMSQSHRRAVLAEVPSAADKFAVLRKDGLDVADPYGRELAAYRRVRDEIRAAVVARLPEWLPGGD